MPTSLSIILHFCTWDSTFLHPRFLSRDTYGKCPKSYISIIMFYFFLHFICMSFSYINFHYIGNIVPKLCFPLWLFYWGITDLPYTIYVCLILIHVHPLNHQNQHNDHHMEKFPGAPYNPFLLPLTESWASSIVRWGLHSSTWPPVVEWRRCVDSACWQYQSP